MIYTYERMIKLTFRLQSRRLSILRKRDAEVHNRNITSVNAVKLTAVIIYVASEILDPLTSLRFMAKMDFGH